MRRRATGRCDDLACYGSWQQLHTVALESDESAPLDNGRRSASE